MATVDELIEQNKLKEEALASSSGVAPAEPSGGLLSRIGNFIGGSDKTDTLDASGLTQADRRQALFAGLSDIGAKLMAAGEPMYGAQRAGILASMGSVPANMAQMRSTIAQQKLLGVKGAQAQRELQVQREMDAAAKDPNHPMWSQFQGQDKALAQWAMRTGGFKAYLDFLAHRNDATYKEMATRKMQAEVNELNQSTAIRNQIMQGLTGGGGTQPAVPGQPPPAVPIEPPAQPSPAGVSTSGSLPPFVGIPGMPQAAITPQQQTLMAAAPPTAEVGGAQAAATAETMQGGGEGGGEPPASIMRVPKPGAPVAPTQLPPLPIPPPPAQAQPAPAQPAPAQPVPGQPPVSNQDIPRAPRTLSEVGQIIPPAQLLPLMGLKGNEFFNALEKLVAPGMTPVFDTKTGNLVNVPANQVYALDPVRYRPAAAAQQAFQEKKFEYDKTQDAKKLELEKLQRDISAAEKGYKIEDGKLIPDPNAQQQLVDLHERKAKVEAEANLKPQELALKAQETALNQWKAGVRPNTITGQLEPDEQAQQAQAKIEGLKAAETAPFAVRQETAKQTFKDHLENSRPRAVAAANQVPLIIEAQELVNKGIKTGTFTEFRQFASQFAETLHMSKMTDAEIRTQGFNQVVQRLAVELLQSKALGSGNSITDTDLKFALNMIENSKGNTTIILRALAHLEGNARRTIDNYGREHDALAQDSYLAPAMKSLAPIKVPDRDKVVKDLNDRWTELNQPATPGLSPEAAKVQRKFGPPRRP